MVFHTKNKIFILHATNSILISNDGNPLIDETQGAVSRDKKAPSAQLGDAMGFGKDKFCFPLV
jgi:hypothetical protein